jgi:ubiquinone/menaquinone biosynthesis C-methylase UbiE
MTVKSEVKRFPNIMLEHPHYSGTMATLLYNWPIFASILFFGVVALSAGWWVTAPWQWLLNVVGAGSFVVIFAILLATYLVYDRGQQREYDRLAELGQVAQANVVLDITCGKLRGTRGLLPHFQRGHYFLIDIYDEKKMTDQALSRARRMEPPLEVGRRIYRQAGQASKLPVPHHWADVIFCDFSLHELQDAEDRAVIFAEFARVLKPNGRILIAEHGRDWLNFLAFGPGIFSFFSPATWEQHISAAGLSIEHHEQWRGLVHLWVVGKRL